VPGEIADGVSIEAVKTAKADAGGQLSINLLSLRMSASRFGLRTAYRTGVHRLSYCVLLARLFGSPFPLERGTTAKQLPPVPIAEISASQPLMARGK
jgi:hypothetical protein